MDMTLEEMNKEYEESLKKQGYVEHLIVALNGQRKHYSFIKSIHAREGTKLVFKHTAGFFRKKCYLDIFDIHNDYRMSLVSIWDNAIFYEECPSFRQMCEGDKDSVQKILDLVVSGKPVDRFFIDSVNKDKRFSCRNCMVDKFSRVCITRNW